MVRPLDLQNVFWTTLLQFLLNGLLTREWKTVTGAKDLIDMKIVDSILHLEKNGAEGFLRKQVGAFETRLPEQLRMIGESVESGNFEELISIVHKLNGFASSLGAKQVRNLCIEIEKIGHLGTVEGTAQLLEELEKTLETTIGLLKELSGE